MSFEAPDDDELLRRGKLPLVDRESIEILTRAIKVFGEGAVIGRNHQYPDTPLHVGVRCQGEWKSFGSGKTWDEAFQNVKRVRHQLPNGSFVFEEEKKK